MKILKAKLSLLDSGRISSVRGEENNRAVMQTISREENIGRTSRSLRDERESP